MNPKGMGKGMRNNDIVIAKAFGIKDFKEVASNAIRTGLNLNDRARITINTVFFQTVTDENIETFFINAKVMGVSLLFRLLLNCQTGDVWSVGISASNQGFNYQFDYLSMTLVGGYSSDGKTYNQGLWITSIPIDKVNDAMAMCLTLEKRGEKIWFSGRWKRFSKWFQKYYEY